MKKLHVVAAGLGYSLLERNGATRLAGFDFSPRRSVFPAVTCVAQASLRTGLTPADHGMISNGWWSEKLRKPLFWEQSCELVKGDRVWSERRRNGNRIGLFFFQQSLGESVDVIVSPAPIHRHGGGMTMSVYTKPGGMSSVLEKACGTFPLWRYWGPFASPKVGRRCIDWFESMTEAQELDEAYLYLPTLDYAAQKYGPGSSADNSAFREFRRQLERLADYCQLHGVEMTVAGDYEITAVTAEPVSPNVLLRREGFFRTRSVGGRAYPDFYESSAFAMCDHEFCVLVGPERERAAKALAEAGVVIAADEQSCPQYIIMLAPNGSWCDYRWWTDKREAPDFASHVDIHNKPGYDPRELFLFNRGTVMGTHGRSCLIASTEERK